MMYKYKNSYLNISKILKVSYLKDYFRFGYKYLKATPDKKTWYGKTIKGRKEAYYVEDFMGEIHETTKENSVYDGKFVRIWYDPKYVDWWNYGIDLEFPTEEEAVSFLKTVETYTEGCKYELQKSKA